MQFPLAYLCQQRLSPSFSAQALDNAILIVTGTFQARLLPKSVHQRIQLALLTLLQLTYCQTQELEESAKFAFICLSSILEGATLGVYAFSWFSFNVLIYQFCFLGGFHSACAKSSSSTVPSSLLLDNFENCLVPSESFLSLEGAPTALLAANVPGLHHLQLPSCVFSHVLTYSNPAYLDPSTEDGLVTLTSISFTHSSQEISSLTFSDKDSNFRKNSSPNPHISYSCPSIQAVPVSASNCPSATPSFMIAKLITEPLLHLCTALLTASNVVPDTDYSRFSSHHQQSASRLHSNCKTSCSSWISSCLLWLSCSLFSLSTTIIWIIVLPFLKLSTNQCCILKRAISIFVSCKIWTSKYPQHYCLPSPVLRNL